MFLWSGFMDLSQYLGWFGALDTSLRVTVVALVVLIAVSLLRKLIKFAILVTLLLITIFVLRAIVSSQT